mmetsp:Transcript_70732/g.195777  ORF Transcript_70732/g.195777 Transcript_70732/m.195777 type:complete len:128 (-) Transcript_70732:170-553(-)
MSGMRFCSRCNNRLYPSENREKKELWYKCRSCDFERPAHVTDEGDEIDKAEVACIFEHDLDKGNTSALKSVRPDVVDDPTLTRMHVADGCPRCGHEKAVSFLSKSGSQARMNLICVCINCTHKWQQE